ncbi:hypothetical protein F1609_22450 [Massilia sp. CCM 8693]|uniref:Secreted protein n=1 Tax=Massilia aquatica TaxID=2609000 RepID=A0ABX0M6U5_9BURK|nr:hypothetical protein [Massilia aquatica]
MIVLWPCQSVTLTAPPAATLMRSLPPPPSISALAPAPIEMVSSPSPPDRTLSAPALTDRLSLPLPPSSLL